MSKLLVLSLVKIYFLYYFLIQIIVLRTEFTPEKLQLQPNSSKCGNNVIDPGEDCDCNQRRASCAKCCNTNCTFRSRNFQCVTGKCCVNCLFQRRTTICRPTFANDVCNLPEYCTGKSAECPPDLWKRDGSSCGFNNSTGYCYRGRCGTIFQGCKNLFNRIITTNKACQEANKNGSEWANCGPTFLDKKRTKFKACDENNYKCGTLHCVGQFRLEDTNSSYLKQFRNNFNFMVHNYNVCTSSYVESPKTVNSFILNDPTYVRNGTPCGEIGDEQAKMCEKQECKFVKDILSRVNCPNNCYNRGECDQHGKCHCWDKSIKTSDCHTEKDLASRGYTIYIIVAAVVIGLVLIVVIARTGCCKDFTRKTLSGTLMNAGSFASVSGFLSKYYGQNNTSPSPNVATGKKSTDQLLSKKS